MFFLFYFFILTNLPKLKNIDKKNLYKSISILIHEILWNNFIFSAIRFGSVRSPSCAGRFPPQSTVPTADAPRCPVWPTTLCRVVPVHHTKPVMIIIISLCVVVATPFGFAHTRKKTTKLLSAHGRERRPHPFWNAAMDVNEVHLHRSLWNKEGERKKHGHSVITSRNL